MSRPLLPAAVVFSLAIPVAASAESGPRIVADIAPVHGLVARVMEGVGEPALLVRPGASPHGYAMKPSEAAALAEAQAVFLVGPELTPWLVKPVETLAPQAARVALLDAPGTLRLPNRVGATFEPHHHHDGEGHGHGHTHDDHAHDGHAHDDHAHDDHSHDGKADEGHDHAHAHDHDHAHHHAEGGTDPHAWLDPRNGKVWLTAIAAELSRIDPANAPVYAANAAEGAAEIDAAEAEVRAELAELPDLNFIVFHDAYQYFEYRFDTPAAGSISLSDATPPGPARVAELRAKVSDMKIDCAFTEPQFNPGLLQTVFAGTDAKTAVIDPVGTEIPTGPAFYPALIRSLGASLASCR